jgi:opacity protein-like surface antigen
MIKLNSLLSVLIILMLPVISSGASNAQTVYGLKGISRLKPSNVIDEYVLYLGAFRNEENATRFYAQIQQKVSPTKVLLQRPNKMKALYVIYIPSIKGLHQLNTIKQKINAPKNIRPSKSQPLIGLHKTSNTLDKQVVIPGSSIRTKQGKGVAETRKTKSKPYLVMLSGGIGWSRPGKTQTVYVEADSSNTYSNQSNLQTLGMGEVFVGVEKKLFNLPIQQQWGALLGAAAMARIKGEIWQFSDPSFNNMSYSYNINQLRVGLRTKWLFDQYALIKEFKPYVTGSLGIGFNRSFSFNNLAKSTDIVANPNFENKVLKAFSYSVGFGLQKNIHDNVQFGFGYELFDWGKSSLAPWAGQTTSAAPSSNNLYMQTLLMSLSIAVE